MKKIKNIILIALYSLVGVFVLYFTMAFVFTYMTVNEFDVDKSEDKIIYLSTNGVYLDIVVPNEDLSPELRGELNYKNVAQYYSFGWGDENFYINVPDWSELTFSIAFKAMFLRSATLMHVTRYGHKDSSWVEVRLNESELKKINQYLVASFQKENNNIILLPNKGYTKKDNFYRAHGSYSCVKTCNSWVNLAFKESGLKACFWTPFDFGLINKYK